MLSFIFCYYYLYTLELAGFGLFNTEKIFNKYLTTLNRTSSDTNPVKIIA